MSNSVYDVVETDDGFKLALRTGLIGESDIIKVRNLIIEWGK